MKTYQLTMSTFIQIPSNLINLTSRSKFIEIYSYLLIRSQIKDNSYKASISEKELAQLTNTSDRTIRNYLDNLKPFFEYVTLYKGNGKYPYNVYQFTKLENDFSIVLPELITDSELTAEEKGILIKIKLQCCKGTNYIRYNSKADLTSIIGISKNLIAKKLKQLEEKGHICYIGNSLQLSTKYFPLSLVKGDSVDAVKNFLYETIYKYCIVNKTIPPLRDNKALNYLIAKFPNIVDSFAEILAKKCQTLPADISLDYFVKALTNNNIDRTKQSCTFIL